MVQLWSRFGAPDLPVGVISARIDALNVTGSKNMTFIEMNKRVVGFAAALGSMALVAGCHSTNSPEPSTYSGYTVTRTASKTPGLSPAAGTAAEGAAAFTNLSAGEEVSIPLYEEQITVGTRTVEAGAVRLRKQVTTETVNQPVQIRRETLVVEREPEGDDAEDAIGKFAPFEAGEIVIKLRQEEPVVEKRIVATGRIVAKSATEAEQVTVSREIRRENIEVEKIGNPQNVRISEKVEARPGDAVGGTGTGSEQTRGSSARGTQGQRDQGKEKDRTPPAEQK
jgi:uncharacterized protein (TIGR02271 family)